MASLSRNEFLDAWQQGYDYRVREEAERTEPLPQNVTDISERIAARALRRHPTTRTGR